MIEITGDSSDTQYYYSADQECTGIRASDTQYCLVGDNEYSLPVTPTAKLSFQYDDASVYQVLEDNGASQRVGEWSRKQCFNLFQCWFGVNTLNLLLNSLYSLCNSAYKQRST